MKNPDADNKKTNKVFAGVIIILITLLLIPILIFLLKPSSPIVAAIVDKTVTEDQRLHHAGLLWFLKSEKIEHLPYFGYYPEDDQIRDIDSSVYQTDLLYLADTYGIYKPESQVVQGESSLLYGGATQQDLYHMQKFLHSMEAKTLIAEYNSFADPTHPAVQSQLGAMFALRSTGWTGQYLVDLSRGKEVPSWAVRRYEQEYGKRWEFTGPGFLFTDDSNQIIVLRLGEEIGESGAQFVYTEQGTELLGLTGSTYYNQVFEITTPAFDAEVLAEFRLDLTDEGRAIFKQAGLPERFPALISRRSALHRTYYMAGNFAYLPYLPKFHMISGAAQLLRRSSRNSLTGEYDFYWNTYIPLLKEILIEVENRKAEQVPPLDTPVSTDGGYNLKARTHGHMLQVYGDSGWEDVFLHGVNLGTALPGRWFTELPQDMSIYYRWFEQIAGMEANTVRTYTLLNPEFYTAFSLYNRLNPDDPIYLLQEIWPEEYPPGDDYIRDEYREAFWQEIIYLIDAIHGNASIPERSGRAWGEFTEDVSSYVIGYLVGRELEPHEVETTDENNEDFTFSGSYLIASEDASATEAWLAESADYALAYESETYGWQHPVAIVNWPTLDPLVHESERDEQGKKEHEFNDYMSVDINNILEGPSMRAGLFGAYHIYPNYPDFMNNDPKYDDYTDEHGRFRYGGYLRQFIEQHTAYPAVIAEFGLATGSGNAHASPDGYHHGSMSEQVQGEGIIRMLEAMKNEDYAGGIIFEWMDEWAKKTWTTEPYMIPYDRQILWHNTIDPEQNYGILALESVKPAAPYVELTSEGVITSASLRSDISYLYIDIELSEDADAQESRLIIGLDTYDRKRGELFYLEEKTYAAPSGMEFQIEIEGSTSGRILVIPPYNSSSYSFSSYPDLQQSGDFEQMVKLINKKRMLLDGTVIPAKYESSSLLSYGDFTGSEHHWFIEDQMIHIRIPWGRINVADPSSARVLDDSRTYYSDPLRDVIDTSVTEGIAVSLLLLDGQERRIDWLPKSGAAEDLMIELEGWNYPVYQQRLKESYGIIREYFSTQERR